MVLAGKLDTKTAPYVLGFNINSNTKCNLKRRRVCSISTVSSTIVAQNLCVSPKVMMSLAHV